MLGAVGLALLMVISAAAAGLLSPTTHPHGSNSLSVRATGSPRPSISRAPADPPVRSTEAYTSSTLRSYGTTGSSTLGLSTVPKVSDTLVLFNNTLVPGNYLAGNGLDPKDAAYDPVNGMLYIAEYGTSNLSIVDPATNLVVGSIPVGGVLAGITYDSGTNELFVSGGGLGLSVIDPTTNTIVATVATSEGPWGLAYDSGAHEVFVADYFSANVSVFSDVTNSLVATIPVGDYPVGVTYDPVLGEIFVGDYSPGQPGVSVINDTSNTVVATISLINDPEYVLYDPLNEDVYVSNLYNLTVLSASTYAVVVNYTLDGFVEEFAFDSGTDQIFASTSDGNVTVVDAANNSLVGNVSLGSGTATGFGGIAYDGAAGEIFVTGQIFNVFVISDSSDTVIANITVGFTPYASAFDSAKDELFETSWQYGDRVAIVSTTTDHLLSYIEVDTGAVAALYDSGRGEIFIAGDSGISVINDTNNSVVATIPAIASAGGMAYDPANGEVFVLDDYGGSISVINDTNNSVVLSPTVVPYAVALTYDSGRGQLFVANAEYGNSSGNVITILNGSTLAFVANVTLAGYGYLLGYDSGAGDVYVSTSYGHLLNISVISDRTDSVLATLPIGALQGGFAYDPTQGEEYATNYAIGDAHIGTNVTVISDATDSIVASVTVGDEPVGASFDAATDQVFVANYGLGTVSIIGQVPGYTATFTESGLPSGTTWTVVLNGSTQSSSGSSIVFPATNGTEPFTVNSVSGYTAAPTSGSLTIEGTSVAKAIQFTATSSGSSPPPTYAVTFSESGLTTGTGWTVDLNGTSKGSTTTLIEFDASNGTETFTVGAVTGYTVAPASGSVTISGAPAGESLIFTSTSSPTSGKNGTGGSGGSSTVLGLPATEGYLLILLIVIILLAVAIVVMRSRRGGNSPPDPNGPAGPGPGASSTPGAPSGTGEPPPPQ
jgi:YVTN family beta-propeller protein